VRQDVEHLESHDAFLSQWVIETTRSAGSSASSAALHHLKVHADRSRDDMNIQVNLSKHLGVIEAAGPVEAAR
jgi:hypothetical protein